MERIRNIFLEFWDSILQILPNILSGVLVFVVFTLIGFSIGRVINSRLQAKWKGTLIAQFMGDIIKWIFIILGTIIAMHFIGLGSIASSILAGAGVSAIIIGFAFKDIAENFLAGILLAVNRPFKLGDIIEIEKYKGPVKKLDLRVTHIRTADGRDIYIPNAMIVKNVLINFTKDGLLRQEFLVGLDTFDDLSKARDLILDYFTKQPDVLNDPLPNMLVDEIAECSINVKILFWVDVLKFKQKKEASDTGETIKSRVMREVKELFVSKGFNLPSIIIEHKMYKENSPLEIKVNNGKWEK